MSGRTLKNAGMTVLLVLLLAALPAFLGCSDESDNIPTGPAQTVDYLVKQGWDQLNQGRVDASIETFALVANADATNLEAYLGLGYAYARTNEPVRAQQNLSNVIALSDVLLEEDLITEAYANAVLAEAYAGKAAAYLAALDYADAVRNARSCAAIWNTSTLQEHRWIDGVNLHNIRLVEANAQYGAGNFNEAMLIADDLEGSFIADAQHILPHSETLSVTMLQDTHTTGIAELVLSNYNLIHPQTITSVASNMECEITSFVSTGNRVSFRCNPVPSVGDQFEVDYLYADDFGLFLIELREMLDSLE